MSQSSERIRIQHMLDAAQRAVAMTSARQRADLDADEMLFLALTRLVEIVGEAAKFVGAPTRARHPEIPWRAIAGARDRLVHGYFDVDRDVLWRMAREDLPSLTASLTLVLGDSALD